MLIDVKGSAAYCYTGAGRFNPALPVVVLVHGAQNDHSVWTLQCRALLAAGYAVLAPDLPGHGRSGGAALASVEALADWLLALCDAAGVGRALFAGHSMGSLIALEAAYRAPRRAAGLALLGSTYPMTVSPALLETARSDEATAIDMVASWSHAGTVPGPSSAGPGISVINTARRLMQRMAARNPHGLLYTDLAACNAYVNGESAAASIACPTVLVMGTHDMMTPPRSTTLLTGAIKHAKVTRVDAGHAMMAQAPAPVCAALIDAARAAFEAQAVS